ncbi:hypothetical protein FQR65_LT17614 [Abscondita terminalis]|nr:hypothetical protein FQR65_LT17614 [Abscondita terminalis]
MSTIDNSYMPSSNINVNWEIDHNYHRIDPDVAEVPISTEGDNLLGDLLNISETVIVDQQIPHLDCTNAPINNATEVNGTSVKTVPQTPKTFSNVKRHAVTPNRYTNSILADACKSYCDAQKIAKDSKLQCTESINSLSSAINTFTTEYVNIASMQNAIEIKKLKLEYYKVFGDALVTDTLGMSTIDNSYMPSSNINVNWEIDHNYHRIDPDVAEVPISTEGDNLLGDLLNISETVIVDQQIPHLDCTNAPINNATEVNGTSVKTVPQTPKTFSNVKRKETLVLVPNTQLYIYVVGHAVTPNRYTNSILADACKSYCDAQKIAKDSKLQCTESINSLSSAINTFTTEYVNIASMQNAIEIKKLKLEYYKVFGTFEGFDSL